MKRNVSLQITLDYEIFGDGSGDVYREQIIPTNHLMNICEQYGAKLTVYFEYGQYLAYEKYSKFDPRLKVMNRAIEEQLKDLVRKGHDVQFHLHPTWLEATFSQEKGFALKKEMYDITSLQYERMVDVLSQGKSFLESLLKPVNPGYKCFAFRAGAWSAQDSRKLISALLEAGYKVDSTVAKGAHLKSDYGTFDFRVTSNKPYWFVDNNICLESESNTTILELPILTQSTKLAPLYYLSKKRKFVNSIVTRFYSTKVTDQGANILTKLKKMLSRDFVLADFNFMPSKTLFAIVKDQIKKTDSHNWNFPITLIGHSKTSYQNDDLHLLFRMLEAEYSVSYDTVTSYYLQNIGN